MNDLITSGIPMVKLACRDLAHVARTLTLVSGMKVTEYGTGSGAAFYMVDYDNRDLGDLYKTMKESEVTLFLINPPDDLDWQFYAIDAGELLPTRGAMITWLDSMLDADDETLQTLADALQGLTFMEATAALALCGDEVTHRALLRAREAIRPTVRGLFLIPTKEVHYHPPMMLSHWLHDMRGFLFHRPMLADRGILLHGEPGTGKSQAAKYLANQLGVPLYRLDVSSMMSKWQGEAEASLRAALATLDQIGACVALIDEMDKLFSDDNSGSAPRMLAQLLWWMQERTSAALLVVTANDMTKIPQELLRPGRIDTVSVMPSAVPRPPIIKATLEELGYPHLLKEALKGMDSTTDDNPARVHNQTKTWLRNYLTNMNL